MPGLSHSRPIDRPAFAVDFSAIGVYHSLQITAELPKYIHRNCLAWTSLSFLTMAIGSLRPEDIKLQHCRRILHCHDCYGV